MILDLHRQGLSVAAIARETGKDAKTIRPYIAHGLEPPVYGPRPPQACRLDPYKAYLQERITAYPQLSGRRLLREVRALGYDGGYTAITDFLRTVRPPATLPFEVRFETPPGRQAQVDFAQFQVEFTDEPAVTRIVAVLAGPGLQPLAVGALRPASGPADGPALPHRGVRRPRRRAGGDPLRPDEDRRHR